MGGVSPNFTPTLLKEPGRSLYLRFASHVPTVQVHESVGPVKMTFRPRSSLCYIAAWQCLMQMQFRGGYSAKLRVVPERRAKVLGCMPKSWMKSFEKCDGSL